MKEHVSTYEVSQFKNSWCNENQIVIETIKNKISESFQSPILDVGAGLGDIAYNALGDKEVICIDVNNITKKDYPLRDKHKRIQVNFFDYSPEQQINTLFISHTLQFLDNDVQKLNNKVQEIDPSSVILIVNKNDGFMGELVKWTGNNCANSHPEKIIGGFPDGYNLVKEHPFEATLTCKDFEELARQISYLMLCELNKTTKQELVGYLKKHLSEPKFGINQLIKIYRKNGKG